MEAMLIRNAIRKVGPLGSAVIALQIASTTRQHWQSLPSEDRERLQDLLRRSRGKPSNLSGAERRELRELVRGLQLPRLVRDAAVNASGLRRQLRRSAD